MDYRFTDMEYNERQSLRPRVFNYILEAILSGRYKAGDQLVEKKLADEIGISRTPVREVLRQLELDGLVTSIPNKGVIVNGITQSDIEEIYAIRALVEGLAVRWAAERMTAEQRRDLEETGELMAYYTRKKDYDQLEKYDAKFHSLIYESCQSKVLRHILHTLMRYVRHARLGSLKVPMRAEQALAEHQAILRALLEGSSERAEAEMTSHINSALVNLIAQKNNK